MIGKSWQHLGLPRRSLTTVLARPWAVWLHSRDLVFSTRYGPPPAQGTGKGCCASLCAQAKILPHQFFQSAKTKGFQPGKEVTEVLKLRHKSNREVLNPSQKATKALDLQSALTLATLVAPVQNKWILTPAKKPQRSSTLATRATERFLTLTRRPQRLLTFGQKPTQLFRRSPYKCFIIGRSNQKGFQPKPNLYRTCCEENKSAIV